MNKIGLVTDEDLGEEVLELQNPRIRYASRGIVINDDGKMAIFNKKNKNEFKLPGGGIEKDESKEDAFIREVYEETGCEIEITDFLGYIEEHRTHENFKQISYVFVGKVIKDTGELHTTLKEQEEGGVLVWEYPDEGLRLISESFDNIIASKYESEYHSKIISMRDRKILSYYLSLKGEKN